MTNTDALEKTKDSDIGDKLNDSLKAYLNPGFILKETDILKVYDENYFLLGKIPVKNPEINIENNAEKDEPEKKEQTIYIQPGLKFDQTYKGKKFAAKAAGGFFFLYNELGVDVFEYFTDDTFCGFDEEKELILFKDKDNNNLYGKSFDGRRFEISSKATQINSSQNKPTNSPEIYVKKEDKPKQNLNQILRLSIFSLKKIIKKNQINADFFISEKLDNPKILKTLLKVYNGDLSELNDEILEAGKNNLDLSIPAGFISIKAALLHQLYINTTLNGRGGHRGKNMKSLLFDLIVLDSYGKLSPLRKKISPKVQQKGIEFFKKLSQKYVDKKGVILRVYSSIINDEEYINLINMNTTVDIDTYKAFLISKLYEFTTRIDRGNGISMINITRALMNVM